MKAAVMPPSLVFLSLWYGLDTYDKDRKRAPNQDTFFLPLSAYSIYN